MTDTLYKRLGGYDAIAAVADDLLPRLMADAQLGGFWRNRAEDSLPRTEGWASGSSPALALMLSSPFQARYESVTG